ncbi:hypothetical protein [Acidovorax sp.]|uniref:hypothetical protein n=1 Tax=Acidovorax sp. TaxID=1872122 RepID=UPI00261D1FD0|nr:hypothetical protein [Acidovorax sp.]
MKFENAIFKFHGSRIVWQPRSLSSPTDTCSPPPAHRRELRRASTTRPTCTVIPSATRQACSSRKPQWLAILKGTHHE